MVFLYCTNTIPPPKTSPPSATTTFHPQKTTTTIRAIFIQRNQQHCDAKFMTPKQQQQLKQLRDEGSDVDGLILTPTDHLSPPSTMSRLSDSDTTSDCDIDGMTPGASISSMGSSASPPPLLEVTTTTTEKNKIKTTKSAKLHWELHTEAETETSVYNTLNKKFAKEEPKQTTDSIKSEDTWLTNTITNTYFNRSLPLSVALSPLHSYIHVNILWSFHQPAQKSIWRNF